MASTADPALDARGDVRRRVGMVRPRDDVGGAGREQLPRARRGHALRVEADGEHARQPGAARGEKHVEEARREAIEDDDAGAVKRIDWNIVRGDPGARQRVEHRRGGVRTLLQEDLSPHSRNPHRAAA